MAEKKTIEQLYAEFKTRNPVLVDELATLALKANEHNVHRIGMKHLIEVLRWDRTIKGDTKPFKINNNYAPLLARDIEDTYPELVGIFEKRKRSYERANIAK